MRGSRRLWLGLLVAASVLIGGAAKVSTTSPHPAAAGPQARPPATVPPQARPHHPPPVALTPAARAQQPPPNVTPEAWGRYGRPATPGPHGSPPATPGR